MTSHAAVVARGMGTCCVSGCAISLWMRRTSSSLWLARPSMKVTGCPSMVLPVTSMMARSRLLMLPSPVSWPCNGLG
ncbi:MAG: PEP-utilizing enzyme [Clostridia bacterium]